MRLASDALASLDRKLHEATSFMALDGVAFGKSELVQAAVQESEALFQGYAKAKPSDADAYAAALALLRGQVLDAWQQDMVASALCSPIKEQAGATIIGSPKLRGLLSSYQDALDRGELWRLTWHGVLFSYFNFDPVVASSDTERAGWREVRAFLERTWPAIDRQTEGNLVPDWITVLRSESAVLTDSPVRRYTKAYLSGDTTAADKLASDLGIPTSSWFWHSLTLGVVTEAAGLPDAEFMGQIPRLIELAKSTPVYRDDVIEVLLKRYHSCIGAPADERLSDFVCHSSVWKNPKLKAAGIATAWNRVPDAVWRMALAWVNERNLRDFFDILAARNKADEGRLEFWTRYMKQIGWTRLCFGADTMSLQRSNAEVRNLIAREEGSYARLMERKEVDAFMMEIGPYLIIEFSKKPNACYVYRSGALPFDRHQRQYEGGTGDLAAGFRDHGHAARIVHTPGWQDRAENELRKLGIQPDCLTLRQPKVTVAKVAKPHAPDLAHSRSLPSTPSGGVSVGLDMARLQRVIASFSGATINDRRRPNGGGRVWVEDPLQRLELGRELKQMGFQWANGNMAWFYPEQ